MVLRLLAFVLLELHVFAFVAIKWKCRFVDWFAIFFVSLSCTTNFTHGTVETQHRAWLFVHFVFCTTDGIKKETKCESEKKKSKQMWEKNKIEENWTDRKREKRLERIKSIQLDRMRASTKYTNRVRKRIWVSAKRIVFRELIFNMIKVRFLIRLNRSPCIRNSQLKKRQRVLVDWCVWCFDC